MMRDRSKKTKAITTGILKARSGRLIDIAREMPRTESANYKCVQRFTSTASLKSILLRLYQEEAVFMAVPYPVAT